MQIGSKNHRLLQVPSPVWILGIITLLLNLSSIMIFSLSPLYLTGVFGMTTVYLGFLEGCVEFCSWTMRVFSGVLSDYLSKRKPVLVFACSLTALARPLFAIAPSIGWVYGAKMLDRIGNGFQATPREALVGDVAPKEIKGTCYGLRQSLGLIGSLIGAIGVMYFMRLSGSDFKFVFKLASIPPILAFLVLIFFVKESPKSIAKEKKKEGSLLATLKQVTKLKAGFWGVICVTGIFMVSNYSGAYRILHAQVAGFSVEDVSLTMIAQNLGAMCAAFPIGKLSDRIDRRLLLAIGFFVTIAADLFLGFSSTMGLVTLGAGLWGVQMGITQSILAAMVADTAEKEVRGTAFGIYYLVIAFALFSANMLMGWLFDAYGPRAGFVTSAAIAASAVCLIALMKPVTKPVTTV